MKRPGIVCELGVQDVKKSWEFYRSLGFESIEVLPDENSPSWAELSYWDSRLMLQETGELVNELPGIARAPVKPSQVIVLRVGAIQDAEILHRTLTKKRISSVSSIRTTDYGTAEFTVRDPDGYIVLIAGAQD